MPEAPNLALGVLVNRATEGVPVAASSEADPVETPAAYLESDYLGDVWQSRSPSESDTILRKDIGYRTDGYPFEIATVALACTNLTPADRVRLLLDAAPLPERVRYAPDSLISKAGCTGALADIDEDPDAPDGTGMESLAANVASTVTVSFPTPASMQGGSMRLHALRMRVRCNSLDPASPGCSVNWIRLREGGVVIRELLEELQIPTRLQVGEERVYYGWFAADELADPSGAGIEAEVSAVKGHINDSLTIQAVDLLVEPPMPASVYDTGQLSVWPDGVAGLLADAHPSEAWASRPPFIHHLRDGAGNFVHRPARYFRLEIYAATNPDGFVEAGALDIGPSLFTTHAGPDLSSGAEDEGQMLSTAAGGDLPFHQLVKRTQRISLVGMPQAERDVLYRFLALRGKAQRFYVTPSPGKAVGVQDLSYPAWLPRGLGDLRRRGKSRPESDLFDGVLFVQEVT